MLIACVPILPSNVCSDKADEVDVEASELLVHSKRPSAPEGIFHL
jgi:hypothetical protein